MHGKVYVGNEPLTHGRVILHHLSPKYQGPVDSVRLGRTGTFTFHLPTVPDSAAGDLYFAAIMHDGVLYFGTPITLPIQLDSLYQIHTYDTTMVAAGGVALPIKVRNLFVEKDSTGRGWRVTDLIEVDNKATRTLTARKDGVVWRYPLPSEGSDFRLGQTGFALDAATFHGDTVVVRAPLPPGLRVFVMRYDVPDPFLTVPMPGLTSTMEVLVREPAPPIGVTGLQVEDDVELEPGANYRHFVGRNLHDVVVGLKRAPAPRLPPVRWVAVILALLLTGFGLRALYKSGGKPSPAGTPAGDGPPQDREALLREIARLDETFDALESPTDEQRTRYAEQRRALLGRLRG